MTITENPLVALIEESIRLKDSAQLVLTEAVGGTVLTRMERLALIMITESDEAMTVSRMSRHLGHPRQVVQRAVNRLDELELVRKLPNPDHKTSALVEATRKGQDFERQLGDKLIAIVDSLLDEGDVKTCERVTRDINRLRVLLENYAAENK